MDNNKFKNLVDKIRNAVSINWTSEQEKDLCNGCKYLESSWHLLIETLYFWKSLIVKDAMNADTMMEFMAFKVMLRANSGALVQCCGLTAAEDLYNMKKNPNRHLVLYLVSNGL